jgi:hypothetical protein
VSGQPFALGAVESFDLAAGLGVVGAGVDEPDPGLADAAFEGDGVACEAAGEAASVV